AAAPRVPTVRRETCRSAFAPPREETHPRSRPRVNPLHSTAAVERSRTSVPSWSRLGSPDAVRAGWFCRVGRSETTAERLSSEAHADHLNNCIRRVGLPVKPSACRVRPTLQEKPFHSTHLKT